MTAPRKPTAPAPRSDRFVGTADDIAFPDAEGNFPVSVLEKRYEGEGIFQELEELADRNELERAPLPPARRRPKK